MHKCGVMGLLLVTPSKPCHDSLQPHPNYQVLVEFDFTSDEVFHVNSRGAAQPFETIIAELEMVSKLRVGSLLPLLTFVS